MADQPRKKDRVENRPVTASARATRATKRSIQDSQQNINKSALSHKSLDDQPNDNELEKGVARRTWKKRPRTYDWVLNASAPGGPVSINLLRGYRGHIACDIWENNFERGGLVIQSRIQAIELFQFKPRDAWYILVKSTRLDHLRQCVFQHHNAPLISVFVERWHPETTSFHLPFREMTITSHDVSMIMGIEISGVAINHPTHRKENRPDLFKFIAKYASNRRETNDVARGYLVTLLGSTVFIDKTVDRASTLLFSLTTDLVGVKTYYWASATLDHLYRELGKASRAECAQLAGPSTLLEAWIYEHFPMF
ncbi:Protein MAIN-LIKE 1 [Bienertia sinuspersici]